MRDLSRRDTEYPDFEFPPISKHRNRNESGKIARGLVLTCVNVPSFVRSALECVHKLGIDKVFDFTCILHCCNRGHYSQYDHSHLCLKHVKYTIQLIRSLNRNDKPLSILTFIPQLSCFYS